MTAAGIDENPVDSEAPHIESNDYYSSAMYQKCKVIVYYQKRITVSHRNAFIECGDGVTLISIFLIRSKSRWYRYQARRRTYS